MIYHYLDDFFILNLNMCVFFGGGGHFLLSNVLRITSKVRDLYDFYVFNEYLLIKAVFIQSKYREKCNIVKLYCNL